MIGLTPVQAKTLAFIRNFIAEKGWSPSFEEVAQGIGFSSRGGVKRIIDALVARGALARAAGRHRSLELVGEARSADGIDFLPEQLAVWVRVVAARAGVSPLDVITECVRDGYMLHRKPQQAPGFAPARETSATAA